MKVATDWMLVVVSRGSTLRLFSPLESLLVPYK